MNEYRVEKNEKEERKKNNATKFCFCSVSEYFNFFKKQWEKNMEWSNKQMEGWNLFQRSYFIFQFPPIPK